MAAPQPAKTALLKKLNPRVGKLRGVVILRRVSDSNVTRDTQDPSNPAPESESNKANDAEIDPLEAARAETSKMREQLLRTAADFDNFRKRTSRETQDATRRAREDFLRDLLPIFDNLERAVAHAETATDVKSLSDGVTMVMRMFADTLNKLGVERLTAVGLPFDPAVHEAVQQIETKDVAPGVVAAEIQAGYRMGERLVRPAMVVVAKPPSSN